MAVLYFAIQYEHSGGGGVSLLDLPAIGLVFIAPVLCLFLFSVHPPPWRFLWRNWQRIQKWNSRQFNEGLEAHSHGSLALGFSKEVVELDEILGLAHQMISNRVENEYIKKTLQARIQRDDEVFQRASGDLQFLARMSPYFGMVATVLGMIRALASMEDMSNITSNIGIALCGTLYGVGLYTLLYSPLEQLVEGLRQELLGRRRLLFAWVVQRLDKEDPYLVSSFLKGQNFDLSSPREVSPPPQPGGSQSPGL